MKKFSFVNFTASFGGLVCVAIGSLLVPFFFAVDMYIFGSFYLVMWLIAAVGMSVNIFGKKIDIDNFGVRYTAPLTEYYLTWEEIKEIGIARYGFSIGGSPFIYFSRQIGIGNRVHPDMISDELIMLKYRKAVIDEIQKYWTDEIKGI